LDIIIVLIAGWYLITLIVTNICM